jgi:hypothetical protein
MLRSMTEWSERLSELVNEHARAAARVELLRERREHLAGELVLWRARVSRVTDSELGAVVARIVERLTAEADAASRELERVQATEQTLRPAVTEQRARWDRAISEAKRTGMDLSRVPAVEFDTVVVLDESAIADDEERDWFARLIDHSSRSSGHGLDGNAGKLGSSRLGSFGSAGE